MYICPFWRLLGRDALFALSENEDIEDRYEWESPGTEEADSNDFHSADGGSRCVFADNLFLSGMVSASGRMECWKSIALTAILTLVSKLDN